MYTGDHWRSQRFTEIIFTRYYPVPPALPGTTGYSRRIVKWLLEVLQSVIREGERGRLRGDYMWTHTLPE
eukprot:334903-Amorphochlora_amoeboformis.AAC.1